MDSNLDLDWGWQGDCCRPRGPCNRSVWMDLTLVQLYCTSAGSERKSVCSCFLPDESHKLNLTPHSDGRRVGPNKTVGPQTVGCLYTLWLTNVNSTHTLHVYIIRIGAAAADLRGAIGLKAGQTGIRFRVAKVGLAGNSSSSAPIVVVSDSFKCFQAAVCLRVALS